MILYYKNIIPGIYIQATVVTILRAVHYKEHVTNVFKIMEKCKILSFKVRGLKYMLKHKVKIYFL